MAHDHHHHHHHAATKNIKMAFFLNLGFTIIEFVGGVLTNSTAILADAVHDLGDCFALGQAWYFERLSGRGTTPQYTYGYRRFSLLGALISTLLILLSSFYILAEAVPRIFAPEPTHAPGMILLAFVGIAVNGYGMLRLSKEKSINARAVGLHLLEDVLGWIAILVVALVLLVKDLPVLDPILAVLITLYILSNVVKNVKSILPVFLQAAPQHIDINTIRSQILAIPHIKDVHHIHLWSLDEDHQVFSAHLVADINLDAQQYAEIKQYVHRLIDEQGLAHSTVEIELPEETCRIAHAPHD